MNTVPRPISRWRSGLLAGPLNASRGIPDEIVCEQTEQTEQTPSDQERNTVSRGDEQTASKPPQLRANLPEGERCIVLGCPSPLADAFYCATDRQRADAGLLWERCTFTACPNARAEGDPLVCGAHRAELDREMALLIERTGHVCQEHPASLEAVA